MDSIGQLLEGITQSINNLINNLGCLVICVLLVLVFFILLI
jgi:hypothetical protein